MIGFWIFSGELLAATLVNTPDSQQQLPKNVYLIQNKGQILDQDFNPRKDVLFYGFDVNQRWFITAEGISYQFHRPTRSAQSHTNASKRRDKLFLTPQEAIPEDIYRVDFRLIDARQPEAIETSGESDYYFNFLGSLYPEAVYEVRSFQSVKLKEILEGVDVEYHCRNGLLEIDFKLSRANDLQRITWTIEGATSLAVDAGGTLIVETPFGRITESAPVAFQHGRKIQGHWLIMENRVQPSFPLSELLSDQPLVIDPPIRIWGTYYGGNNQEVPYGIATDETNKEIYLCGNTTSTNNIATTGAHQATFGGTLDAFLAKFDYSGTLLWGTYYSALGEAEGIAVGYNNGNVYLCGRTIQSPTKQKNYFKYAFVAKFSGSGEFQWLRLFGGTTDNEYEIFTSIAFLSNGNVVCAGHTDANDVPTTEGVFQQNHAGGMDAMIAIFDHSTGDVIAATYLGGSGNDGVYLHCLGGNTVQNYSQEIIYCAGMTYSPNFPIAGSGIYSEGPLDEEDSFADIFFSVFSADLSQLFLSTYFGGNGTDEGPTVAVPDFPFNQSHWITFMSKSETIDNNIRPTTEDLYDIYVAVFNINFDNSNWNLNQNGFFIPREPSEEGNNTMPRIIFWDKYHFLLLYQTSSNELPVLIDDNPGWDESREDNNLVILMYNTDYQSFTYSSFYGNNVMEGIESYGLAKIYPSVFLFGSTYEDNSLITPGAHQTQHGGEEDAFLARFDIAWVWNGTTSDTLWNQANNWKNQIVPPHQNFYMNEDEEQILPDIIIPLGKKAVIAQSSPEMVTMRYLAIDDYGQLVVSPQNILDVRGKITKLFNDEANPMENEQILLRSNINQTAQMLHDYPLASATIQRYIRGYGNNQWAAWHFLSSPVINQPISAFDFVGDTDDFYKWDEVQDLWINRTTSNGQLNTDFETDFVLGRGYLIAKKNDTIIPFQGRINVENLSRRGLTHTEGNIYAGWNFLGNPFACPVRWHKNDPNDPDDIVNWWLHNIDAIAQMWNGTAASYQLVQPGDHIPSAMGFMVRVSTPAGGALIIPANARNPEVNTHWWQKNQIIPRPDQIILQATDLTYNLWQETVIGFHPEATSSYDNQFDSYFLAGFAPYFYSIQEDKPMALQTLPDWTPDLIIPLGFKKNHSSSFQIELTSNTSGAPNIFLYDLQERKKINLTRQSYCFTSRETDPTRRFFLTFSDDIDFSDLTDKQVEISVNHKIVTLRGVSVFNIIEVMDISGKTLLTHPVQGKNEVQISLYQPSGVYILRLIGDAQVISRKIILP